LPNKKGINKKNLSNLNYEENIFDNLDKKDSLLFLSNKKHNIFNNFKIKKKWFSNYVFNFDDCIKHLKETERIYIIKDDIYEKFMKRYSIYYDDEEHKNNPRRDTLYRRITDNYYVSNNDYFEKSKDFYFKLYSNIFTCFNLREIKFDIFKNSSEEKYTNVGATVEVITMNVAKNTTTQSKNEKGIQMEFEKKCETRGLRDLYEEFNGCNTDTKVINFFKDPLRIYQKMDIYSPIMILNLIRNRTRNELSRFQQIQNFENTDTNSVELSIKVKYNLHSELGLFACSKKSNYVNQRVIFNILFYPTKDIEATIIYPPYNNLFNPIKPITPIDPIKPIIPITPIDPINSINPTNPTNPIIPINPITTNPIHNNLPETVINPDPPNTNLPVTVKSTPSSTKFPTTVNNTNNNTTTPTQIIECNPKSLWIKWVDICRGTSIPLNSIEGGITSTDGLIYVGKIKNSPGKVNTEKDKVWNYWVQNEGSSTSGKMLITNAKYKWQPINRGDEIPRQAIYCGKDGSNDCVWIGKSVKDNELGKINCKNNKQILADNIPIMHNFWSHNCYSASQNALILVINETKTDMYNCNIIEEEML